MKVGDTAQGGLALNILRTETGYTIYHESHVVSYVTVDGEGGAFGPQWVLDLLKYILKSHKEDTKRPVFQGLLIRPGDLVPSLYTFSEVSDIRWTIGDSTVIPVVNQNGIGFFARAPGLAPAENRLGEVFSKHLGGPRAPGTVIGTVVIAGLAEGWGTFGIDKSLRSLEPRFLDFFLHVSVPPKPPKA